MSGVVRELEQRRLAVQTKLDAAKDQAERNRLGQFATPTGLAVEMLQYAREQLDEALCIRFLDPAIGTGSFYSALLGVFPEERLASAVGYEIDPQYGLAAAKLWDGAGLEVRLDDFTRSDPASKSEKFNLLISNPPYVRHHHITNDNKKRLKERAWRACGVEVNGLAGLYCYFLCLSHVWMAEGGLAGWLVPSEFMDVNYGVSVKSYLLDKVTLTHIHRFDPDEVQFGDALVSSSIVWFRKKSLPRDHEVLMTYGGSLLRPKLERLVPIEVLVHDRKWTKYPRNEIREKSDAPVLSDFFNIKLADWRRAATITSYYQSSKLKVGVCLSRRFDRYSQVTCQKTRLLRMKQAHPILERRLFLLDCRGG